MSFTTKLNEIWKTNNSLVCVGLDPDLKKLPESLKNHKEPIFEFNRQIIDQTHDLVCAYKPQMAYYAGQNALDQLLRTIEYLKTNYPKIPVILDAKRGDIGPTAQMYGKEAFDIFKADALTVNPYMGTDSLLPLLEREDKGIIILCRTSNSGAFDFQTKKVGEHFLYEEVAHLASSKWNKFNNVSLVVGATATDEIQRVRNIVGNMPLLVPGIGAQGGNLKNTINFGIDKNKTGLIINSSRAIIYASNDANFAKKAKEATKELKDKINELRFN